MPSTPAGGGLTVVLSVLVEQGIGGLPLGLDANAFGFTASATDVAATYRAMKD
jgi:hypothetical protein